MPNWMSPDDCDDGDGPDCPNCDGPMERAEDCDGRDWCPVCDRDEDEGPVCEKCGDELDTDFDEEGVFHQCPTCNVIQHPIPPRCGAAVPQEMPF